MFDSGHLMKNPLCVLLTQCDHRQRVESFPLILLRLFCQGSCIVFWDNLNILRLFLDDIGAIISTASGALVVGGVRDICM